MATVSTSFFDDLLRRSHFLERFPQFAGVIARMQPVAARAITSMAVGIHPYAAPGREIRLFLNPDYFQRQPDHFAPILLHEIHHVIFRHLTDPQLHVVLWPRIMEVAMEISADEFIDDQLVMTFPVAAFSEFGLQPNQSTFDRYRLLVSARDRGQFDVLSSTEFRIRLPEVAVRYPSLSERARVMVFTSTKKRFFRAPKKVVRVAVVEWPDQHYLTGSIDESIQGIGDALDQKSDEAKGSTWEQMGGLGARTNPAQLRRMKQKIKSHILGDDETSNAVGFGLGEPKDLGRFVQGGILMRGVNWHRMIDRAFPRRRLAVPSYLQPNRRFADKIGIVPGRRRRPPKRRLIAAIDTSASMQSDDLGFIREDVARLAQCADVVVLQCDAAIHRVAKDFRIDEMRGGGDTDFRPIFSWADDHRGDFDGLVFFTDGRGRLPERPPKIATLWALTNDDPFPCPFGTMIKIGGGRPARAPDELRDSTRTK